MENILSRKVLLLNNSYEALGIISSKKAIIMLLSKKVDYIEKTKELIRSEKLNIIIPDIVKLKTYIYIKNRKIALTRKNIFKRDQYKCQYCGGGNNLLLTLDHVIPKQKGGVDSWENLVSACTKCNINKGNKFLSDTRMKLLKKPKQPHYLMFLQDYVNIEYNKWKPYLYMV